CSRVQPPKGSSRQTLPADPHPDALAREPLVLAKLGLAGPAPERRLAGGHTQFWALQSLVTIHCFRSYHFLFCHVYVACLSPYSPYVLHAASRLLSPVPSLALVLGWDLSRPSKERS